MAAQPKAILKPIAATKPMIRAKDEFGVSNTNVKLPLPKTYKFRVAMWCEGCALDVKQALEGAKGPRSIVDYSIDYNTKRVTISSPLSLDEVYKILTKAGKEATLEDTGGAVSK